LKLVKADSGSAKGPGKQFKDFCAARLGAVDPRANRREVQGRRGTHGANQVVEREVGHPTKRRAIPLDGVEEQAGIDDPFEGIEQHERRAGNEWE